MQGVPDSDVYASTLDDVQATTLDLSTQNSMCDKTRGNSIAYTKDGKMMLIEKEKFVWKNIPTMRNTTPNGDQ